MNGISLSKILLAVRGVHGTASLKKKKHFFRFFNRDGIFQLCLSIFDSVIRLSIFDFRFSRTCSRRHDHKLIQDISQ